MKKTIWLDLETTGLNPNENGIVQIAILVEEDGDIVDKFESKMNPGKVEFSQYALDVNKLTKEEIKKYPSQKDVVKNLITFLDKHKIKDKLTVAGYNVKFDIKFLSKIITFTNYFHWYDLDVFALLKVARQQELYDGGMKLVEACEYYKIKHDAHEAMSDIKATRKLYKKLLK